MSFRLTITFVLFLASWLVTQTRIVRAEETSPCQSSETIVSSSEVTASPSDNSLPAAEVSSESLPSLNQETSPTESNPQNSSNETQTLSPRLPRPGELRINEIVSNPSEGNEWVELFSAAVEPLTLADLAIKDGGNRGITLDGIIEPYAYRLFFFSSATLNNSGDAVKLLAPDGNLLDAVSYGDWEENPLALEAPAKGSSLVRDDTASFRLTTTPTPGVVNLITAPQTPPVVVPDSSPPQETTVSESPSAARPQPAQEVSAAPRSYSPGALLISELYPAPYAGEEEWVELFNPGSESISLVDWFLTDAAGTRTPLGLSIAPQVFLTIREPRGHLNNSGDTVNLHDPSGAIISSLAYEGVKRGEAYAFDGSIFKRSVVPTPGASNQIQIPEDEKEEIRFALVQEEVEELGSGAAAPAVKKQKTSVKKSRTKKSPDPPLEVTLTEARSLAKGTVVRTQGVVSVAPGVFGSRTFYLAGSGMQVYAHGLDLPDLSVGDVLEVEGKLGSSGGETRLVVSKADALRVTGHGDAPTPEAMDIGVLDDETEGWLVTVEGTVTEKTNGRLMVEDASGAIPVVVKSGSGIDQRSVSVGSAVRLTGIVSETKSGFRLLPRGADDLSVLALATPTEEAAPARRPISFLSIGAGFLILALIGMVVWKKISEQRMKSAVVVGSAL
ncbi:lamin tail domain-containing protein [Candidatus Uhrbacteria bacterium]|nr:lamin tail domain-containing protein [Candidatus Uhrbacteria bacterium]